MLKPINEAVAPITMGATNTTTTTPSTTSNVKNTTTLPSVNPATASIPKTPTQNQDMAAMKAKITKAINESADLITALECVGAMYCIPSTNIIADDTASSIRVINDNIIAPPIENPGDNMVKPIMCAISSVLDYISQRIDDKLDDYQNNNMERGRMNDIPTNPVMGINPDPNASYFNDEDDITNDVDMNASPDVSAENDNLTETDVADDIQESAKILDMISKRNNTTHLGYDIMQEQGFDFVKPVDSVVMESDTEDGDDDKKKKKKKIHVEDIKHMKFDNKNILAAVKCFNEARDDQDNMKDGKMNIDKFINNPDYEKGVKYLEKQFDCHISMEFLRPGQMNHNTMTYISASYKKHLSVSKSKGFQLNGLPIYIMTSAHFFENESPEDRTLFGQKMVAVILHEIFHNIASVMRRANAQAGMSLAMTISAAGATKNPEERRIIITNYVDTLDECRGNGIFNKMAKKRMIKQLTILASIQDNDGLVREFGNKMKSDDGNDVDKLIKEYIKAYKKGLRKVKPSPKKYIFPVVATAASIVGGVIAGGSLLAPGVGLGLLLGFGTLAKLGMDSEYFIIRKNYRNTHLYEEYWCDLFAGMYNLPPFFFTAGMKNKHGSNDFKDEDVAELTKLEKDFYEAIFASYPTDMERTYAAVKIARNLLKDEKNLDPAVKKYAQWIVDNFSNLEKANIDKIYNKTTFDPKEAEDLDKHLQELIRDNNVVLTESFVTWMNSNLNTFNG